MAGLQGRLPTKILFSLPAFHFSDPFLPPLLKYHLRTGLHRTLLAGGDALNAHQLRLEDEGGIGRDDLASTALAVAELRGDGELALLANLHAQETLVPALDDLPGANLKLERLAALVACVKLLAVRQRAPVMHVDGVACVLR